MIILIFFKILKFSFWIMSWVVYEKKYWLSYARFFQKKISYVRYYLTWMNDYVVQDKRDFLLGCAIWKIMQWLIRMNSQKRVHRTWKIKIEIYIFKYLFFIKKCSKLNHVKIQLKLFLSKISQLNYKVQSKT